MLFFKTGITKTVIITTRTNLLINKLTIIIISPMYFHKCNRVFTVKQVIQTKQRKSKKPDYKTTATTGAKPKNLKKSSNKTKWKTIEQRKTRKTPIAGIKIMLSPH